jgi:membrane dipeptidase
MFVVDAHLDLAYNALKYNRDLLTTVEAVREKEANQRRPNGTAMVTIPSLQAAGVGLVFSTIFVKPASGTEEPSAKELIYRDAGEAFSLGQAQLDYYHRLADEVETIRLVGDLTELDAVVTSHQDGQEPLLGLIPLLEGADPIREPAEAELWYERGLRIIGLAWGDTRYSAGAWRGSGGLTKEGRHLLEIMAELGFILDLTHMAEEATLQALDSYEGVVIATHSNARALVPGQRQLSDIQIRRIAERDGVIGVVLFNGFLKEEYAKGDPKSTVTAENIVAHIDHICQCVGDSAHVGIGSDFDGGFGVEATPEGINTHSDLGLLSLALKGYGYSDDEVAGILGGNWLRLVRHAFNQ